MTRIAKIRLAYNEALDKHCGQNHVGFISLQKLLESEKTKKLLKKNALIQQNIDKEIENAVANENR